MKMVVTKLCQDVLNFIHNYYYSMIVLILITTLFQMILDYTLLPKQEEIIFMKDFIGMSIKDIIQELSTEQRQVLIQLSVANNISKLLSYTFLLSNMLAMLHTITTAKINYSLNIIKNTIFLSIKIFPKNLILILITTLFIQLGLMLAIIPGILLSISISLSPMIIIDHNVSIKQAILTSLKISSKNWYSISPAILLWFFTKTITVLIFIQYSDTHKFIIKIITNSLNNALFIIMLTYLYRLYIIQKK